MLEYFTYKKIKKHQAEKRARAQVQEPLINEEDEHFLTRIVSAEGTPPPLPERPQGWRIEAGDSTGNASQVIPDGEDYEHDDNGNAKGKENEKPTDTKKANRFSFLHRHSTNKACSDSLIPQSHYLTYQQDNLKPSPDVDPAEATKEEDDINRVLDDLNLAAVNNRAFSISKESQELVRKFTVILKDLVNGVPTAYDDLVHLLDDAQGTLAKSYDHLPSFLKKLIKQLPNKMTSNLAPELLAVATEAQAVHAASGSSSGGGLGGAAKGLFKITSLKDLVTKPGAVVSLLKAIMNALKLRWPAFMGTNVLLSLALFGKLNRLVSFHRDISTDSLSTVLLFVFWYCHKRGRETRLEKERAVDSDGRVIELDDDPMISEAAARHDQGRESSRRHTTREQHEENSSSSSGAPAERNPARSTA
jgi:hypothetical protein